jgi:hypothetical protein
MNSLNSILEGIAVVENQNRSEKIKRNLCKTGASTSGVCELFRPGKTAASLSNGEITKLTYSQNTDQRLRRLIRFLTKNRRIALSHNPRKRPE